MVNVVAIRGAFFDFIDDPWKHVGHEETSARFNPDGLMIIEDGKIKAFGPYDQISPKYSGVPVTHVKERLILPGFIDGHIHVPQTRVLGAFGQQLLPWLNKWVFPEEKKYKDRAYAKEGTRGFFENLIASGTTTCQAFTTTSPVATEEFFEEATRRNMLVLGGVTGMDRFAPADSMSSAQDFYKDSKRLIEKYHRKGRNLYAITPRFALGATPELLESCQRLKQEHPDCWVNTHISENPSEIRGVKEFHRCEDYLAVYEKYNLVGKKFSGGHGVWLSDAEFRRVARADASITFCPLSNLFLGSGLFRLGRATDPDHRVRLSFGTDMGGGNRFSMINVLDEAYKVGMVNNTLLDGSVDPRWEDPEESERNKLSPYRAFYSVTLGGAHGLYIDDRVGNFDPGKEADFVTLDWNVGQRAMVWHGSLLVGKKGPTTMQEAADLLFSIMVIGDDRNVDETWIMGKQAYKRAW